jgi:prefoldin subunit 5
MVPKKGGLKKLRARFDTLKKQIDRVKKDGANVELALSQLAEVEQHLKKGDEAEVTRILGNIDIIVKQAKAKKKYDMMIFNSLPIIEKAKRAGADVGASEALLEEAGRLLDAGEFGEAHEKIKMARREADNAKHFMTAKAHIQRLAPTVEAAKRRGVNVQDVTKIIIESWDALNHGNYDLVTELVKKASTILNIAEEQKSYEISIKDMEARISALSKSGVKTDEMAKLLDDAKKALAESNYGDVRTHVDKIRREI